MAITVTVAASNTLLTTLDRIKAELSITTGDDDIVLADMILRASSAIARETRRTFGVETVTETMDGTGSRLLPLTRTPIVSISEVLEDSTAITDYSLEDAEAGALYRANGWGISGGLRMWGTEAYSSGYILSGYRDLRYQVTYRAGYLLPSDVNPWLNSTGETLQNLPGAVEQACLETVKATYLDRDTDPSVGAVRVGNLSVTYRGDSGSSGASMSLPMAALGLLRNYYQGYGR